MLADPVVVRGNATPEEVAAVLAALQRAGAEAPVRAPDGYERWRRTRLTAIARG